MSVRHSRLKLTLQLYPLQLLRCFILHFDLLESNICSSFFEVINWKGANCKSRNLLPRNYW